MNPFREYQIRDDQLLALVKANAYVYFSSISNGYSHEESLESVLKSRYMILRYNRKRVKALFIEYIENVTENVDCNSEINELNILIQAIAFNELFYKPSLNHIYGYIVLSQYL
ncbi:hypothetical protein ACFL6K_04000 [Candidatus Latescibacterota bacterium]